MARGQRFYNPGYTGGERALVRVNTTSGAVTYSAETSNSSIGSALASDGTGRIFEAQSTLKQIAEFTNSGTFVQALDTGAGLSYTGLAVDGNG